MSNFKLERECYSRLYPDIVIRWELIDDIMEVISDQGHNEISINYITTHLYMIHQHEASARKELDDLLYELKMSGNMVGAIAQESINKNIYDIWRFICINNISRNEFNIIINILSNKIVSPITNHESEWERVSYINNVATYRNIRFDRVYKVDYEDKDITIVYDKIPVMCNECLLTTHLKTVQLPYTPNKYECMYVIHVDDSIYQVTKEEHDKFYNICEPIIKPII